ncbi:MAG TPA: EamA family transporter [Actinomycetota bacterium]|nr:EamA family transporter [Actinomycetota bacterium]
MIFGLGAAVGWGLADFFGAMSGRRIGALGAVIAGQLLSLAAMTTILVSTGTSVDPLSESLWLVAVNGVVSAFAYATHYRALELGPVAVVSPIGAGYAVVGVGLAILILGERPSALALVGAATAVVGVALVSTDLKKLREGIEHHVPGLWWSVAAAVGFGVAGFLLGWISQRAGWMPGLWASRLAQVVCFVPLALVFRDELRRLRPGAGLWIALLAGAADLLGVVMYSAGSERGFISIVLAASAVFPLIAVVLSVLVFGERVVANQVVGIVLVVGGLLLLGLG